MSGVGTLNEKSLHSQLKQWLATPEDAFEVPIDRFVIDLVRSNGDLVEVQTRNLGAMRIKLEALLDQHHITVAVPLPVEKWLIKIDDDGVVLDRRRSPKKMRHLSVCSELMRIPDLLAHSNLTILAMLIHEEEVRKFKPEKRRGRGGWGGVERSLLEVVEVWEIATPFDLLAYLPDLGSQFTTADVARCGEISRRIAGQVAYCLRRSGVARVVDKVGNGHVYELNPDSA